MNFKLGRVIKGEDVFSQDEDLEHFTSPLEETCEMFDLCFGLKANFSWRGNIANIFP